MSDQSRFLGYTLSVVGALATGAVVGHFISRKLESSCTLKDTSRDRKRLMQAISYSTDKHKDQKRKNSKQWPYICHPVRVASLLSEEANIDNIDVIIAALLHDTVEDTDATLEEIERLFGSTVAKIVDEVSDDKTLPKMVRKQQQIDHAPHISPEAKLVKLADKLDNLSELLVETPVGWVPERVGQYFEWAEEVINGMRGTNETLEARLDGVLASRQKAMDCAAATKATPP